MLGYKMLRNIKNYFVGFFYFTRWHARHAIATVKDHYYDLRLGIETDGTFPFKDTSKNKDMDKHGISPYGTIREIIEYLKPNQEDVFIDYGCGTGRMIFFAANRELKKVVGVELNKEIADAAMRNYRNLKNAVTPVEIIIADAAHFNADEGTIFYLYNPFGRKTVSAVIGNIKKSLTLHPRKIRIVDYGLQCRYLFEDEPWLELEKEMNEGEILIWRNKL